MNNKKIIFLILILIGVCGAVLTSTLEGKGERVKCYDENDNEILGLDCLSHGYIHFTWITWVFLLIGITGVWWIIK